MVLWWFVVFLDSRCMVIGVLLVLCFCAMCYCLLLRSVCLFFVCDGSKWVQANHSRAVVLPQFVPKMCRICEDG